MKNGFKLISVVILLALAGCNGVGCVYENDFGGDTTTVKADPSNVADGGLQGSCNGAAGGQRAGWKDTGYYTSGDDFIIQIGGEWSSWYGLDSSVTSSTSFLEHTPSCNMVAVNNGGDAHYIATNYQYNTELAKPPDDQEPCWYSGGYGLYMAFFDPKTNELYGDRAYQLRAQGAWVDDITKASRFVWHSDGEIAPLGKKIKLMILDNCYIDNSGSYSLTFFRGIQRTGFQMVEWLVGHFEDAILGPANKETGTRSGGILKEAFNAIVQNSGFFAFARVFLTLYICFYGLGVAIGIIEMTYANMILRTLRITIVLFLTSPSSWWFYNEYILEFFLAATKTVIGITTGSVAEYYLQNPPAGGTGGMIQSIAIGGNTSEGARFAFLDEFIKLLFAENTNKKIAALFFYDVTGLFYVIIIYAIMFGIVYIAILAAMLYVVTLTQLMIGLVIGPVMACCLLFDKSRDYFKNWLSFVMGKALAPIIVFTVLYLFIILIRKEFVDFLTFKVCWNSVYSDATSATLQTLGLDLKFWRNPNPTRSTGEMWVSLIGLAALTALAWYMLGKAANIADAIISIGGVSAKAGGGVANAMDIGKFMTNNLLGQVMSTTKDIYNNQTLRDVASVASRPFRAAAGAAFNAMPGHGALKAISPRHIIAKMMINSAIKKARAGGGSDADIRQRAMGELFKTMSSLGGEMAGVNMRQIAKQMDKVLLTDNLSKQMAIFSKELKNRPADQLKFGAEFRDELKGKITEWAKTNLAATPQAVEKMLNGAVKGDLMKYSAFSSREAARVFGDNKDVSRKFLDSLHDESKLRRDGTIAGAFSRAYHTLKRDSAYNPQQVRTNFFKRKADWQGYDPTTWDITNKEATHERHKARIEYSSHGVANEAEKRKEIYDASKAKIEAIKAENHSPEQRNMLIRKEQALCEKKLHEHEEKILGLQAHLESKMALGLKDSLSKKQEEIKDEAAKALHRTADAITLNQSKIEQKLTAEYQAGLTTLKTLHAGKADNYNDALAEHNRWYANEKRILEDRAAWALRMPHSDESVTLNANARDEAATLARLKTEEATAITAETALKKEIAQNAADAAATSKDWLDSTALVEADAEKFRALQAARATEDAALPALDVAAIEARRIAREAEDLAAATEAEHLRKEASDAYEAHVEAERLHRESAEKLEDAIQTRVDAENARHESSVRLDIISDAIASKSIDAMFEPEEAAKKRAVLETEANERAVINLKSSEERELKRAEALAAADAAKKAAEAKALEQIESEKLKKIMADARDTAEPDKMKAAKQVLDTIATTAGKKGSVNKSIIAYELADIKAELRRARSQATPDAALIASLTQKETEIQTKLDAIVDDIP